MKLDINYIKSKASNGDSVEFEGKLSTVKPPENIDNPYSDRKQWMKISDSTGDIPVVFYYHTSKTEGLMTSDSGKHVSVKGKVNVYNGKVSITFAKVTIIESKENKIEQPETKIPCPDFFPDSMKISYSKDIVVACISSGLIKNKKEIKETLDYFFNSINSIISAKSAEKEFEKSIEQDPDQEEIPID